MLLVLNEYSGRTTRYKLQEQEAPHVSYAADSLGKITPRTIEEAVEVVIERRASVSNCSSMPSAVWPLPWR